MISRRFLIENLLGVKSDIKVPDFDLSLVLLPNRKLNLRLRTPGTYLMERDFFKTI